MSAVVAPGPSQGVHSQVSDTSVPVVAVPQEQRLAGLDGVRGLAALYVVVFHIFLRAFPGYPGVPAFLVSLGLTLPLSIVLARPFASAFEIPFLRHRSSGGPVRRQQARAEGAPG